MHELSKRAALALPLCLAGACAPASSADRAGEMRMGVVGQDADGNFYRLRDGTFDISGPETLSVSTEDSADPVNALSLELAAGNYDIALQDGWRLERFDPIADASLDVVATLTSENPASAVVTGSAAETVVFEFSVQDAGPVALGDGDLDIDIDVDVDIPVGAACDPLVQDCAAGEACYATEVDGESGFFCFPEFPGNLYAECSFINACDSGLTCLAPTSNTNCDQDDTGCCLQICDLGAPACGTGETCTPLGPAGLGAGICAL